MHRTAKGSRRRVLARREVDWSFVSVCGTSRQTPAEFRRCRPNWMQGELWEGEKGEARPMECRNGRKGSGFYRRVSSTVGRQWRMVEVQVQCARALGEGGTMLLTSSRSSGCGRRAKSWSGASGYCRCPCGCRRRARRLRARPGPVEVSVGFVGMSGSCANRRGGAVLSGEGGAAGHCARPWRPRQGVLAGHGVHERRGCACVWALQ